MALNYYRLPDDIPTTTEYDPGRRSENLSSSIERIFSRSLHRAVSQGRKAAFGPLSAVYDRRLRPATTPITTPLATPPASRSQTFAPLPAATAAAVVVVDAGPTTA